MQNIDQWGLLQQMIRYDHMTFYLDRGVRVYSHSPINEKTLKVYNNSENVHDHEIIVPLKNEMYNSLAVKFKWRSQSRVVEEHFTVILSRDELPISIQERKGA